MDLDTFMLVKQFDPPSPILPSMGLKPSKDDGFIFALRILVPQKRDRNVKSIEIVMIDCSIIFGITKIVDPGFV